MRPASSRKHQYPVNSANIAPIPKEADSPSNRSDAMADANNKADIAIKRRAVGEWRNPSNRCATHIMVRK